MAAYYYVKTGGTAAAATDNGRYASQQTGTFAAIGAAGYYAKIEDALAATTTPVDGDFICCSDLHDYDAVAAQIVYGVVASTVNVNIVSVDDANCENYKAGATERQSSGTGGDIAFNASLVMWGMTFTTVDNFTMSVSAADAVFNECTLSILNNIGTFGMGNAGQSIILRDSTIEYGNVTCYINMQSGGIIHMYGGSIASTAGGDGFVNYLLQGYASSGGVSYFEGVDLSIVDIYLIRVPSTTDDDLVLAHFHNCKLNSAVSYTDGLKNANKTCLVTNSGSTAAGSEYQYHFETRGLLVDDIDTIYRNNSTPFPSGQQIGLKAVTDTLTSQTRPASFEFPSLFAELSSTGTDLIRIFIVSSTALTDIEVWAEASYPDGTNTHWGNHVASSNAISGGFSQDPFATGTTLTTNSEVWTSPPATPNYYQIDLDTSADVGADGIPVIRVYVAKASATIYFCPDVELF